jgi:predicted acyltransferase
VLSGFLPRLASLLRWVESTDADGTKHYTSFLSWFYTHLCKPIAADPRVGSLVYALCMIAFYWLIVYILDKKKIYIKV